MLTSNISTWTMVEAEGTKLAFAIFFNDTIYVLCKPITSASTTDCRLAVTYLTCRQTSSLQLGDNQFKRGNCWWPCCWQNQLWWPRPRRRMSEVSWCAYSRPLLLLMKISVIIDHWKLTFCDWRRIGLVLALKLRCLTSVRWPVSLSAVRQPWWCDGCFRLVMAVFNDH